MSLRAQPLEALLRSSAFPASRSRLLAHHTRPYHFPRNRAAFPVACARRSHHHPPNLAAAPRSRKSGTGLWTVALVLGIGISGALLVPLVRPSSGQQQSAKATSPQFELADLTDSHLVMAPNTPPGRPGTLTPDQETKLRELWAVTMRVFGVDGSRESISGDAATSVSTGEASVADGKKDKKKSRLNVFKRSKGDKSGDVDSTATSGSTTPTDFSKLSLSADDDKHGQNAEFRTALANMEPEDLRAAFWSMVKHDHPDALLLRFLRARKWDVEKALIMMVSTMHWRLDEMHVDDDIVKNGELGALQNTTSDAKSKKNDEDFMAQLRMGKSFLHGLDKEGRPLCFVRVRLHRQGEQTGESLERFTIYTIETARMLLRPPIDTATVIFDMTDFSMANMDYTPVKFMIKCFEANYPESLGTVLVYKAPWVFNAIWSIIRGWLDPVVAGKVHFAKNIDELSTYVPKSQIPTELGGDEKWEYSYPEPVPGENDRMKEAGVRNELEGERKSIVDRYERSILEWVHAGDAAAAETADQRRRERDEIAEQLRQNYWKLDPYIRARSLYDRVGLLSEGGKLDFYGKEKAAATAPAKTVETSADDLD
ncbi:hypothetical protein T440DRAFT_250312 [Plenodomus tracheiphilus IPT5]|uniref:CRAL-TRIO domain-containing protein n=1 Tax=Plenodomus tracheiphilus IPT5 TaxID=1408161 RepID=A0A6A7ASD9_9PLEO|nr:hypothetical protein T440DRAFT_250312 [Plenodomus tracheiphilus IPT5]